ncbi:MAG: methyltransferase domain-containing protein [Chitinophagaceae bacterium]
MRAIKNLYTFLSDRPVNVVFWKLYCKLFGIRIPYFQHWKELVNNKVGLEIGGPSSLFTQNNFLPVYPYLKSLDGVNFSSHTVWEGQIKQGKTYNYGGQLGVQFIAEGTDLNIIKSNTYDFLLSCNNLEHIANPIKALKEWQRVIKPAAVLILVLPRKESNFDHRRSITSLNHIINDFENNIDENDTTALIEVLELHDLKRDHNAGNMENFKRRSLDNFNTRTLHHHVFDVKLLEQLMDYIGMKTILTYSSPTDHFIAAVKRS